MSLSTETEDVSPVLLFSSSFGPHEIGSWEIILLFPEGKAQIPKEKKSNKCRPRTQPLSRCWQYVYIIITNGEVDGAERGRPGRQEHGRGGKDPQSSKRRQQSGGHTGDSRSH